MDEPTKAELQAERYKMALEAILAMYARGDRAHEIAKNALHGKFANAEKL